MHALGGLSRSDVVHYAGFFSFVCSRHPCLPTCRYCECVELVAFAWGWDVRRATPIDLPTVGALLILCYKSLCCHDTACGKAFARERQRTNESWFGSCTCLRRQAGGAGCEDVFGGKLHAAANCTQFFPAGLAD